MVAAKRSRMLVDDIKRKPLIMIGPDVDGLGGISRVIKTLRNCKVFEENRIHYISSVHKSAPLEKLFSLINGFTKFLFLAIFNCRGIYIHTATRNSFYRKLLFISVAVVLSKKTILHIHPSYFYPFIMSLKGIKRNFIFYLLGKIDCFVVLTESMKNKLLQLFPQKKIYVLKNPVALDQMQNKNGVFRKNDQLLFLGWYLKVKGVYDLIDAVKIVTERGHDVTLEMYGTYNTQKLKNYVAEKKLCNVNVNGWIGDDAKLKALYGSTMLILPSYSEGIPNVILEAMATKTPIVATAVGGLKEILQNHKNALTVQPKNPEDLSEKITELLQDQNLRNRIASEAFGYARQEFDVEIIKSKLNHIIQCEFN